MPPPTENDLASLVRDMPGKRCCDLSRLLGDAAAFRTTSERLAAPFAEDGVDLVIGLDAAGLPFAAAVALHLDAGLVLLRREGKAAWTTRSAACRDYSQTDKRFEVVDDAIAPGRRCLVVDDWAETGAQLALAKELVESMGGVVAGFACVHVDEDARRNPTLAGHELVSAIP